MVTLLLDSTQLEVALSPIERALSFRRRSVRVAREHIRRAQLTDDAWTWLRGVPDPGTHLPGAAAMGTWRSAGGSDFVVIRRRRPGVVIDLDGDEEFERLVLTTQHGVALVRALHLEGEGLPEDVAVVTPAPRRRPALRPRPVSPRPVS